MSAKLKVVKGGKNMLNLSQYKRKNMKCPFKEEEVVAYAIPVDRIYHGGHNPARRKKGTQQSNVSQLLTSLSTVGQDEPVCVEWNTSMGRFDLVFGFNRIRAIGMAINMGYQIPNGLDGHIWAYMFTGSVADRIVLQMKENGNKKPGAPATKDDIATMLSKYIKAGGFDTAEYEIPFFQLNDEAKKKRAREFLKKEVPFWGGRKFRGVWNHMVKNHSGNSASSFKTWDKYKMAEHWRVHSHLGISKEAINKEKPSGLVVDINGVRTAVYFVTAKTEMAGALPTNAAKKRVKEKCEKLIVVASLDSSASKIGNARKGFTVDAKWWNENIFHTFDEVFWVKQTEEETETIWPLGQFVKHDIL